jgi:uncharacterized protein (AIM24 family)
MTSVFTATVNGHFALMRTGRIDFSVEKSTRSLLRTITSGEGLLQTFRGTGSVWRGHSPVPC